MKRLHYALVGLMLLLLTGCGQTVVETLQVPQASGPNAPGRGKTIVILPFADYTYADSLSAAHRRDMAITESLTDAVRTDPAVADLARRLEAEVAAGGTTPTAAARTIRATLDYRHCAGIGPAGQAQIVQHTLQPLGVACCRLVAPAHPGTLAQRCAKTGTASSQLFQAQRSITKAMLVRDAAQRLLSRLAAGIQAIEIAGVCKVVLV